MTRYTPNMEGAASTITDTQLLFARIGYRTYLNYLAGEPNEFRQGYMNAELKQLAKLRDETPKRGDQRDT